MAVRVGARGGGTRTGVRKLRRPVASAAAPSFNPLTSWTTDPVHGVWASDPLWTPPADGGAVSSWRNGGSVGTPNLTQGTGAAQPTYDASLASFNNAAVVTFDGTDDFLLADIADLAQPYWVVAIARASAVTVTRSIYGLGTNAGYRYGIGNTPFPWRARVDADLTGGTADTNPHLHVVKWQGATSTIALDGTSIASGTTGTAVSMMHLSVGSATNGTTGSVFWIGDIAYVAVFDTDPTAQAEWATFKSWCLSFYGITVA